MLKELLTKYKIQPKGIIHIGAHKGEELREYRDCKIQNIIFIEANPALMPDLLDVINNNKDLNIRTFFYAVCNENRDNVDFYVTSNSMSSSLLRLDKHKVYYPKINETQTIKVNCRKLANIIISHKVEIKEYNILYMDIQGSELEALKGAWGFLKDFDIVITEMNKVELYKGCALYDEVDKFLNDNEFIQVNYKQWTKVFGDGYYIKKTLKNNKK